LAVQPRPYGAGLGKGGPSHRDEGISPEQAVDEAIAGIKQILSE
jgi:hypothetical protein